MSNQTHIYIKFVSEPFIIFIYAFQYQDKKYEIRNWLAFKKKKKNSSEFICMSNISGMSFRRQTIGKSNETRKKQQYTWTIEMPIRLASVPIFLQRF